MEDRDLAEADRYIARLEKEIKKSEAAYDSLEDELSQAKSEANSQGERAASWEASYRDHNRICGRRYADVKLQLDVLKDSDDTLVELEKAKAENAELSVRLVYTEEARREATSAFQELRFGGKYGDNPIGKLIDVREKVGKASRAVSPYARRGLEQCQDEIDRIITLLKYQQTS